jgi:PKD repeat protein/GH35 family endo-1,4-beta-xylanase
VTLYDDDNIPSGEDVLRADTQTDFEFWERDEYGDREIVPVTGMPFTEASRITVTNTPNENHYIGIYTQLLDEVSQGETLLLSFWARNAGVQSWAEVRAVYENSKTYDKSLSNTQTLTDHDWQRFDLAFEAMETYDADEAKLSFFVGFGEQTVEIGGVEVTKYEGISPDDLPPAAQTYQGRSGRETAWRDEAQNDIERNRMANLTVEVVDAAGNPISGAVVEVKLVEHAFGFGSAVNERGIKDLHLEEPNYPPSFIADHFNKVTVENRLKWPYWESDRGRAIRMIDWLHENGIDDIRGHNLIWPSWSHIPDSVKDEYERRVTDDGQSAAAEWLRQRILAHIADEAGQAGVKKRLTDWDVVNEPYSNHEIQDILSRELGGDPLKYVVEWFEAAEAADRKARLFLNDYPSLAGGRHLDAYCDTIQYVLDNGESLEGNGEVLDGIGIQGHFGASVPGVGAMWENLERLGNLGPLLQITEFDQESRDAELRLDEQLQADFLRDFMTLAFSHPKMDAFLIWGFWGGWREEAGLWDADWKLKPNGRQWLDLVQTEWHTETRGSTFADGTVRTLGYLGSYEVEVSARGETSTWTGDLERHGTTARVTICNNYPVADPNGPYILDQGADLVLDGSDSYDPNASTGDSIVGYRWDLDNDGQFDDATGAQPTVPWATVNSLMDHSADPVNRLPTNTIQLQVEDTFGLTSTASTTVTIYDTRPVASFTWAPKPQDEGSAVQFTDGSTSSYDAIVSWNWDFDVLGSSTEQNPTFTFTDDGSYAVTLSVTDDDGSTYTVTHTVTVNNVAPSSLTLEAVPPIQLNGTATLTGSFIDPGTPDVHTLTIDWGDGVTEKVTLSADERTFSEEHQYAEADEYTVTATVSDDDTGSDKATTTVLVYLEDLGPVDFLERDFMLSDGGSNGKQLRRLETTHDALLTLEAFDPAAKIWLLNDQGEDCGECSLDSGKQRLDYGVSAGEMYLFQLTAEGTVHVRLTNLVRESNATVTVHGTDDADRFSYVHVGTPRITVKGVEYRGGAHFDHDVTTVEFFGNEGADYIKIRGSTEDETARLWAEGNTVGNSLEFRGLGVTVTAAGIEETNLLGEGGTDTATLTDTGHKDNLIARGENVTLQDGTVTWEGKPLRLKSEDHKYKFTTKGFHSVTVTSTQGDDEAYFFGSGGDETYQATSEEATFEREGYITTAISFWKTHAYGKAGYDEAYLSGGLGKDRFHVTWAYGRIFGANPDDGDAYVHRAIRFNKVTAEATPGSDVAQLYAGPYDDRLEGKLGAADTGERAETNWRLAYNDRNDTAKFEYVARDFPVVKASGIDADGIDSGWDSAQLYKRPADTFKAIGTGEAKLLNKDYLIWVRDFDEIELHDIADWPFTTGSTLPSALLDLEHDGGLVEEDPAALAYAHMKGPSDRTGTDQHDQEAVNVVLETEFMWTRRRG